MLLEVYSIDDTTTKKDIFLTETLHIYIRVSTETQKQDGFGLETQEEWGVSLSKELSFEHKIWNEGSASSSNDNLDKRPVLLNLLDEMERGEIKHLYVYNSDRLSRNQNTWGLIRWKISKNSVLLYTGRDTSPIDTNDPTQNLVMGVLSEISQYENQIRRIRLTSGKFKKVKLGGWMGGPTPFGYQNIDGYLRVHPTEGKWVRKIYEDYSNGHTTTEIRSTLLANGVRTRRGNPRWSLGSIRSVLTNTHYNGSYVVNDKSKDELITCECPEIISPKLFKEVTEKFKERSYHRKGRVKQGREQADYLSKEFLECGHCSSRFGVRNNKVQYRNHYFCRGNSNDWNNSGNIPELRCKDRVRSILVDQTDKIVWETICDILGRSHHFKETFKQNIEQTERTYTKSLDETKAIEKKIKKLKSDIKEVTEFRSQYQGMSLMKGDTEEEIRRTLMVFEEQRTNYRVELETLQMRKKDINNQTVWVNWIKRFGEDMERWKSENFPFDEKKKIVKSIVNSIKVVSEDKTSHRLIVHLSVPWVNDQFKWKFKKNKTGKSQKDGYIINVGEEYFETDLIPTLKKTVMN